MVARIPSRLYCWLERGFVSWRGMGGIWGQSGRLRVRTRYWSNSEGNRWDTQGKTHNTDASDGILTLNGLS